jgi:subtilisin family serine protease
MGMIDARLQRQMYLRGVSPDAPMEIPAEGDRPKVLVRFSGDVADLERAGMHVETVVGDIAVGHVDIASVQELSQIAHVSAVEAAQPTKPLIHDSVPAIHADIVRTGPLALTGTGVVVGVVDTGIDIFHHAFRNTDADGTTRILSLWDQTLTAQAGEAPPTGFTFGVEFTAAAINAVLKSGASSFRSTDTNGHGTHVAGIAAGNGSASGNCHDPGYYIGVAPAADLVIVKTKFDSASDILAAKYIFSVASTASKPAVINFSLGGQTGNGPHNGTSTFETGLDALVGGAGTAIVVSAGNDGDTGIHAFASIPASSSRTLSFVVPAYDKTTDFLDVWYTGGGQLSLTLTAPSGTAYSKVNPGASYGPLTFGATGGDKVNAGTTTSGAWNSISVDISPASAGDSITSGTWKITLQEVGGTAVGVDAWFATSHTDQFPTFIKTDQDPTRTITVPATANNVICVGAYDYRDKTLASFSSRGPRVDGTLKPDICAPGVAIYSAKSKDRSNDWFCSDCCKNFIDEDGTSMAAPHITGVSALVFQRNKGLTFDKVRTAIKASGQVPPISGLTLPNNDWGSGIVDAQIACTGVTPAAAMLPVGGGAGAGSGGGGSGGGGGAMFSAMGDPFPVSPSAYSSPAARLRALERRFGGHPLWHTCAALVSMHYDEVAKLTNENAKVAAMWHRLGGARLLIWLLTSASPDLVLPEEFAGRPLATTLSRWLGMLDRYGSPALQADIARHGPLLLSLPGNGLPGSLPAAG